MTTTYVHNTPATAYNHIPKGWKKIDTPANPAPNGYFWISNNQSFFSGKRKVALVKKPVKRPIHQTAVPNHNKRLDDRRGALDPGKRVSRNGKVYYEYRVNRSDCADEQVDYTKFIVEKRKATTIVDDIKKQESKLKAVQKRIESIKSATKKNDEVWRKATLQMDKLNQKKATHISRSVQVKAYQDKHHSRIQHNRQHKAGLNAGVVSLKKKISVCKDTNRKLSSDLSKALSDEKKIRERIYQLKQRLA